MHSSISLSTPGYAQQYLSLSPPLAINVSHMTEFPTDAVVEREIDTALQSPWGCPR